MGPTPHPHSQGTHRALGIRFILHRIQGRKPSWPARQQPAFVLGRNSLHNCQGALFVGSPDKSSGERKDSHISWLQALPWLASLLTQRSQYLLQQHHGHNCLSDIHSFSSPNAIYQSSLLPYKSSWWKSLSDFQKREAKK